MEMTELKGTNYEKAKQLMELLKNRQIPIEELEKGIDSFSAVYS